MTGLLKLLSSHMAGSALYALSRPAPWPVTDVAQIRPTPPRRPLPPIEGPRVELLGWNEIVKALPAWTDLTGRLLEPNVFLEPGFAMSAARHFPEARRPSFLAVFDQRSPRQFEDMIGICALEVNGGFQPITRSWMPKQFALGAPLLDQSRSLSAFAAMLGWIEREQPRAAGLLFPSIIRDGPTASLLRQTARVRGLVFQETARGERATLLGSDSEAFLSSLAMSGKHVKELRRQGRRLAERGSLGYSSARDPAAVGEQMERFLWLESKGWKGARGTALLLDPAHATFARSMARLLAREGKCNVDALELDGVPIAMGISLLSGDQAFLWKIAYDEAFAAYSPGAQFIREYTRRQLARQEIRATDSCALPDHPMIDRHWADKTAIADFALAVSGRRQAAFEAALRRAHLRGRLRGYAKSAYTTASAFARS